MNNMGSHLKLKDELQDEFVNFTVQSHPSSSFTAILSSINLLKTPDNIDVLKSIFRVVIEKRNSSYAKLLLSFICKYKDIFVMPLLNDINNAIEILFESENIGFALKTVELLLNQTDARTLRILNHYSSLIINKTHFKKILFLSGKLEARINEYMNKIEFLNLNPIITQYDRWQE